MSKRLKGAFSGAWLKITECYHDNKMEVIMQCLSVVAWLLICLWLLTVVQPTIDMVIGFGVLACGGSLSLIAMIRWAVHFPGLELYQNDGELAVTFLLEDLSRVQNNMIVFSDKAAGWLWGKGNNSTEEKAEKDASDWGEVEKSIREKAKKGVTFIFYVSKSEFNDPSNDHDVISRLKEQGVIKLIVLDERPPKDLRWIDERHVHISDHCLDDGNRNRACWRSGPLGVSRADRKTIEGFIKTYADASMRSEAA